jgi:TolB-like protein
VKFVPVLAVFLVAVASPEATAQPRQRVVVLPISPSEPALAMLAGTVAEQVASELSRSPELEVVSASDIAVTIGIERQKELLGCAETRDQCMTEMSAALGAPWILSGSLGRAGDRYRLDLKLLRSSDGKAVFRSGESLQKESEVFDAVTRLVAAVRPAMGLSGPSGPSFSTVAPWVLTGLGVAAAGTGAVLLGEANGVKQQLSDPTSRATLTWTQATQAYSQSTTWNTTGEVLVIAGGAAIVGGLVWWLLSPADSGPPRVTVFPTGAGLSIAGTL